MFQLHVLVGRAETVGLGVLFEQAAHCMRLVACRTDSSYARWEEALKTWNEVRSLSKDLARQVCG